MAELDSFGVATALGLPLTERATCGCASPIESFAVPFGVFAGEDEGDMSAAVIVPVLIPKFVWIDLDCVAAE